MLKYMPLSRIRWVSPIAIAAKRLWNGTSSPSIDKVIPRSNQSDSPGVSVADTCTKGGVSDRRKLGGSPLTSTSTWSPATRTGSSSVVK